VIEGAADRSDRVADPRIGLQRRNQIGDGLKHISASRGKNLRTSLIDLQGIVGSHLDGISPGIALV
jgi:hypothetical protein